MRENSAEAFAELVARHIDLVHSAARRQSRNEHEAQDITQAVFLVLARKAGTLHDARRLPAWLLKTAHFAALDARKAALRRRKHEQEVSSMNAEAVPPPDPEWDRLSPRIDGALAKLSETDRAVVVGHCIQQQRMTEIAVMLGVTEMAARKRVQRAMERLRKHLKAAGLPSAGLAALLAVRAVHAAPLGMSKTVAATSLTNGNAGTAKIAMSLAKGAMKMAFWKTARVTIAAVLVPLGGTFIAVLWEECSHKPSIQGQSTVTAATQGTLPAGSGIVESKALDVPVDPSQDAAPGEYYMDGDLPRRGVYSLGTGKVTMKQAIATAGADVSKPASVTLLRRRGNVQEKYAYDLEGLMSGIQADVVLEANDIVQVTKK